VWTAATKGDVGMNAIREEAPAIEESRSIDLLFIDAQCDLSDIENLVWAANRLLTDDNRDPRIDDCEYMERASSVLRASLKAIGGLNNLLGRMERTAHGINR
jgi:hypothetical protein